MHVSGSGNYGFCIGHKCCHVKDCPADQCQKAKCDTHANCATDPADDGTVCHVKGKDGKCEHGECIVGCDPAHCPSDECEVPICDAHGNCGTDKAPDGTKCNFEIDHISKHGKCKHGHCLPYAPFIFFMQLCLDVCACMHDRPQGFKCCATTIMSRGDLCVLGSCFHASLEDTCSECISVLSDLYLAGTV